ncbi:MAG: FIST signal transduction protein [Gammaproteobacteria bacterium]
MAQSQTKPRFHGAHARGDDWRHAVDKCVGQLTGALSMPLGGSANGDEYLGFAFVTDLAAEHLEQIEARLREATGVQHWVGTVGIGVCACGHEYFDEPAAAILVAQLPAGSFRVFEQCAGDGRGLRFPGRAEDGPPWSDATGPAFGLVHGDPNTADLPDRLTALSRQVATGFLVGGLASSRGPTHLMANGQLTGGTVAGVLLDSNVAVSTRLSQGCLPIGPRREITGCRQNLLIELDGRPALEVFREDIGEELNRDLSRVGGLIFAALPIAGSDTGDYLVRNLLGLDPGDGVVAIGENVAPGDTVMFCRRDPHSAGEDLRRMLRELASRLDGPPAGGLYYTCLARGPNLFGPNSEELRLIKQELGSFPLAGFFGNGEISHDRLYAYTGVLTVFH